jgi:hypothetical protein
LILVQRQELQKVIQSRIADIETGNAMQVT